MNVFSPSFPMPRALLWITLMLAVASAAFAQAGGERVGEAACAACHPDVLKTFEATLHAKAQRSLATKDAELARCESCHGAGSAHLAAGGGAVAPGSGWNDFRGSEGAARETEVCLGCHQGGAQTHWQTSVHARDGGRCSNCHDVHRNLSETHLLAKRSEAELCSSCHLLPRSQMRKSAHMPARGGPIGEGWMNCSSCHNPHGTVNRNLIAAHTVNDNCTSCHAEKRGPFLHEHAPVNESCLNCHDPHGSLNSGMLKVSGPRLCQGCHIATLHPSEARAPGERQVIGRNCMQCHQKIHGSNHPSGFGFTR